MRYFREITIWKILLLNIVVGMLMSGPFMMGIVLLNGMFTASTVDDKIAGVFIFLLIISVIIFSNYLLWKYGRKKYDVDIENEGKRKNIILFKVMLIVIILLIALGSFFILPNIWSIFNSWWF